VLDEARSAVAVSMVDAEVARGVGTMSRVPIDINADVGEGLDAIDAELMPLISSANIACGGHAGDRVSMRRTVAAALSHGVAIGAHPGYPDKDGFGRREVELSDSQLRSTLSRQISDLAAVAARLGGKLVHVKPHGALYNRAATDESTAATIIDIVRAHDRGLTVVGLAGSRLLDAGRAAGMRVAAEGFADRAYEPDGSLRPRSMAGAVLADPDAVAAQALAIARDGRVELDGGSALVLRVETLCLHGDTPGAVASAQRVRAVLKAASVPVGPLRHADV
jgi:UPF0271 protein